MKTDIQNYAFIDSQNLNLSIRDMGWRLDFGKFRKYLHDKYSVTKAFIFIGYIPENKRLYELFYNTGYVVIFKPTLEKNGIIKGNCDAELVLHCMIELRNFNKAVIVSSDGDFHCLLEYLDMNGKLLKLITPSKNYSSLLRKFAKYIVPVSLFRDKIERR